MKKRQIKNDIRPTVFEEKEGRRVWHDETILQSTKLI